MSRGTPILVIDDGELDSACAILEQLGADFERLPGSSARAPVRHPETLLLSSEARARSLRMQRAAVGSNPRATWIAFAAEGSETPMPALSAAGFDFLVREPVHPTALRVLLQRALYRGPDARHAPRVAFGKPVTFKTGAWRETAILIDLSPSGCRLLTPRPAKERSEIAVALPATLAGGATLELLGHVVRVSSAELECGRIGETTVGVRFAPLDPSTRERLAAVLAERVLGPALLAADAVPGESEPRPPRLYRRASYAKKLTAMESGNAYMVMCRDISERGMRIEPVAGG
ncbi:MAG: PilZ domain-containing protein, partial [Deltaproteobacteria bacterium]|nr:PilZ domain-containing protein [Deltaproteobacteria bacterium]